MQAWQTLRTWSEMIKFSHSVFALPFAFVAAFLAGRHLPAGRPTLSHLVLILICMVGARSFAMTFNRIADRFIDARNSRTARRALPAGNISLTAAWMFLITAAGVFLAGCAGFLVWHQNPWPAYLSLPTLLALAAYSYAKHITTMSHFILGTVIAFAPTAAWIAVDPASLGMPTVLLTAAVASWIAGFDVIYACQDVEFDRAEGLRSLPARIGVAHSLQIARYAHLLTVVLLAGLGGMEQLGWLYGAAIVLTALLLTYEHSLVRPNDLTRINVAFFTVNGVVSLIFAAAAIGDILTRDGGHVIRQVYP